MTILSYKILRYNFFVNSLIPYITTPAAIIRYGWTTLQVTALTSFLAEWNAKFASYVNPILFGPITINAINESYQKGFPITQASRSQIKNNATLTLSSEEKIVLNLKNADTTHTSVGIPKNAPSIACIGQSSLSMQFIAINPPLPFKSAKPDGVDEIGFKTATTKAGAPPPDLKDYVRQENESTTKFEMLFTTPQVGDTLYIIGFYINGKNEAGKDGIPCIVTII